MEAKHYYIIAANVVYESTGVNEGMAVLPLNALLVTDNESLSNISFLSHAQAAIQNQFMSKTDNKLKIIDIVVINIMHCGKMTEEEFHGK